jgi:hypothetical protein
LNLWPVATARGSDPRELKAFLQAALEKADRQEFLSYGRTFTNSSISSIVL